MRVGGDGCVEVPTSLYVSVCACGCVFLPMPHRNRCIDTVYFACGAHYGGGRGNHGAVHQYVVTLNG